MCVAASDEMVAAQLASLKEEARGQAAREVLEEARLQVMGRGGGEGGREGGGEGAGRLGGAGRGEAAGEEGKEEGLEGRGCI